MPNSSCDLQNIIDWGLFDTVRCGQLLQGFTMDGMKHAKDYMSP